MQHAMKLSWVLLAVLALAEGRFFRTPSEAVSDAVHVVSDAVHVVSDAVRKPLTDRRKYEHVTFANGLKVLAVEDPRAAKAGFAVAVEAGSFYDPEDFPGLAHFCEHLLFLGTKKYPDETSFDNFMSLHDGSNNAYTEQERTVFYNEAGHAGFDEGMDRFAQFFIAPLFKQEMVGRELNAVNSEHEKNKPDQGRRLWEIMRGTARQESVLSHFYTGTVESLHHGDASAVAALRKYHDANYCAPRMNLVMVSNLTLSAQLEVAHRHFDGVPRGSCGPPKDFGPSQAGALAAPFGGDHLGQFVRMGTKSTPTLWMMYPLQPTQAQYREGPVQYLSYVLGYAGKGSLKSELKKQGLITDLGMQADENSAASLLFLNYELTPKGAEDAGVRQIVEITSSYMRILHEERGHEVPDVYSSIQQMSKVSFDYSEAPDSVMDAVSDLAAAMSRFPAADVLTGTNGVIDQPDPALVRNLLAQLATPGSANIALATPAFNQSEANGYEKYYDIHFHRGRIPEDWTQSSAASQLAGGPSTTGLAAAPPLRFVPSSMSLQNETAGPYPEVLMLGKTPGSNATQSPLELWWKGQGAFVLPKAQLRLKLSLPAANSTDVSQDAATGAFRRLHVALAKQVLEEATEDLQQCGVNFDLGSAGDGYGISADGYDQHIGVLVLQVLGGLLSPAFGADEFARAHRQVTDEMADTTRKAPFQLAMDELGALTTEHAASREDMLASLASVDEAKLRSYLQKLPSSGFRVQLLVVGNMGKPAAKQLANGVAWAVAGTDKHGPGAGRLLTAGEARRQRVWVATRPVEIRMRNPIPGDRNSATVNSYQYGVTDVSERVRLLLLGKMLANPVYDTLRTKKQLGYIVDGFVTEQANVLELRVLVQGDKELPDRVDADISAVLEDFGAGLKNMSAIEFAKWKASVGSALQHKDQNMGQEADRYWGQIANDGHCFNRKELAQQYLESLQAPADVLAVFEKLKQANKISVKMFGAAASEAELRLDRLAMPQGGALAVSSTQLSSLRVASATAADKLSLLTQGGSSFYSAETVCRISK